MAYPDLPPTFRLWNAQSCMYLLMHLKMNMFRQLLEWHLFISYGLTHRCADLRRQNHLSASSAKVNTLTILPKIPPQRKDKLAGVDHAFFWRPSCQILDHRFHKFFAHIKINKTETFHADC